LRALAVLLGLVLGALLCELVLRLAEGTGDAGQPRYRFDARYGQIPRVGDSATEGAFVPPERAYPARFELLANAARAEGRVRAVNAGVWGMTTIDELTFLRDRLLPLSPQVVVLGLFMPNDVNMNLAHGRRRLRYQAPTWLDALRERSLLAERLFLSALALNQRYRVIAPGTLGSRWVDERIAQVESHGLHMLSYPAGELALYVRDGSALVDEAFGVLREALRQLQQLGRAHGFSLRVLVIPSASTVLGRLSILAHPGILTELRQQGIAIDPRMLDFQRPLRRVLALCAELELACVDGTPALRTLGARAFFPRDEHPTVAGHEALARALLASP
jgi:hypothetical protein